MSKSHNQGKEIVYLGSPHEARNGPPDWCKTPPNGVTIGYPNFVGATLLKAPAETVLVGGQPVMTMGSTLGLPSDPEHSGTMGGTRSGTYRAEAAPIAGSPDLFAEGLAVIRSGDRMRQNHANTVGHMVGTGSGADASGVTGLREKKCYLEELVGFSVMAGQRLGYKNAAKSGDPSYLEVFQHDKVQFIARRRDLETDELFPACASGEPHSKFTFLVKTYPLGAEVVLPLEGIDQYQFPAEDAIILFPEWFTEQVNKLLSVRHTAIDAYWLREMGITVTNEEIEQRGSEVYAERFNLANSDVREHHDHVGAHGAETDDSDGQILENTGSARQRRRVARRLAEQELIREKLEAAQEQYHWERGKLIVYSLWQIFALWRWLQFPPVINLLVNTCSGSKAATVVVYPKATYRWEISHTIPEDRPRHPWISSFFDKCEQIKDAMQKARNLCEAAAPRVSFDVQLLDTFAVSLEARYMRCTSDEEIVNRLTGRVIDYITPAHLRLEWTFSISLDPLIGMEFSYKYNALKLLGLIFPALGNAAGWLLDKLNTGIYATFSLAFNFGVAGTIGVDQNYEVTSPNIAATMTVTPSLILSIEVTKWVDLVTVTFACELALSFELELALDITPKLRMYGAWSYTTTAKLEAGGVMGYTFIEIPEEEDNEEVERPDEEDPAKVEILSGGVGTAGDPYDPKAERVLLGQFALGGT